MATSADLLRLGIVREATPGVTPATPAFQLLRVTSESLAYQPQTTQSNELNPARQLADVIVTGGNSGGEISYEISSNPGLELLLEGVLANVWDTDFLWVGNQVLSHTIEKRFILNEQDPDPTRQYEFERIVRGLVDAMTLTFTPGGPATGSATILGGAFTRGDAELAGATHVSAGKLPVMVGAGITPITFTVEGVDYTGWCLSNLVVAFNNNGRAIACLGQEAASEMVLGRFECAITGDIYLTADSRVVMDAFLERDEIGVAFTASDSLGNAYHFTFPRVRVSGAVAAASGTNQDVVINATMQALVDTLQPLTDPVETCVLIEREHVTDPWPEGT